MDRRAFLGGALGLMAPASALAAGKCVSVAYGGVCTTALRFDAALRSFDFDRYDRWGWTSAVSLIFAYYGYRVAPETIVDKAYDGTFGLTGDFVENARQLNRPWVDETGKAFECVVRPIFAMTPYAQNVAIGEMIGSIDRGQPVLLCDLRHAMVLTSVTYRNDPVSPQVKRAEVVDAWQDNEHVHVLDAADLTAPPDGRLHLAASVAVYEAGTPGHALIRRRVPPA
ncbi:MAG TPA: hypothetical protein VMH86_14220 [Rhizomicrobium sp.]|nr:hypothetical protein [Rhizomicrobium sp.]